jgi:hypothetical protein
VQVTCGVGIDNANAPISHTRAGQERGFLQVCAVGLIDLSLQQWFGVKSIFTAGVSLMFVRKTMEGDDSTSPGLSRGPITRHHRDVVMRSLPD